MPLYCTRHHDQRSVRYVGDVLICMAAVSQSVSVYKVAVWLSRAMLLTTVLHSPPRSAQRKMQRSSPAL
jgi:hypothetical protein